MLATRCAPLGRQMRRTILFTNRARERTKNFSGRCRPRTPGLLRSVGRTRWGQIRPRGYASAATSQSSGGSAEAAALMLYHVSGFGIHADLMRA